MTNLNIHEAKTHLSRYVARVQQGESIILCKNGIPVAQIVPLPKNKRPKRHLFGLGKDKVINMDHFSDQLTEEDLPGMGL